MNKEKVNPGGRERSEKRGGYYVALSDEEFQKIMKGWNPQVCSRSHYIRELLLSRKVPFFYRSAEWEQLLEEMISLKREWRRALEALLEEGNLPSPARQGEAGDGSLAPPLPLQQELLESQRRMEVLIDKIGREWLRQYGSLPARTAQ